MSEPGIPDRLKAIGFQAEDPATRPYRRLWQSVLIENLRAAADFPVVNGKEAVGVARLRLVEGARRWIESRHFREVAELAGFDGAALHTCSLRLLQSGELQSVLKSRRSGHAVF